MAKKIMDKDYDEKSGVSTITFPDGQKIVTSITQLGATQSGDGVWSIAAGSVAMRALLHGINQKLGDSASGAKGNADEAYESVMSTFEQITSGEWNAKREG